MNLINGISSFFYRTKKRKVLDFSSGGIFQAGLGNDAGPIHRAMDIDLLTCYSPHHTNKYTRRYIDMLKEWTGFESVALFSTGAEATEAFWRACIVHTGKRGIWGGLIDPDLVGTNDPKCDAMHGVTLGARIMAGSTTAPELGIGPDMGAARFGLTPESTGCMIMEPYHGPSAQFHRLQPTIERIVANQKEFPDIPLCLDEIQGGFGRTGTQWAYQHYWGLEPDFITIGKGAGAGMPLSALLGPKDIMESKAAKKHAHLHSTHSGHPMMCAVGCYVIEMMERLDLIERSRYLGEILDAGLKDCGIRYHAGKGLLAGLEFNDVNEANKMVAACERRDLMVVKTGRKWVKIGPALTIKEIDLEDGIARLRVAIAGVLDARK